MASVWPRKVTCAAHVMEELAEKLGFEFTPDLTRSQARPARRMRTEALDLLRQF